MNLSKLISICAFVGMSASLSADEYCPTLTTANLAAAACSTQTNLFKTDPAGSFGYYANPVCPWGMKTKKWLQSWTSSAKKYEGNPFGQEAGIVKCTYKLPNEAWRKYVNNRWYLNVSIVINTPELANYWLSDPLCPNLSVSNVYHLAKEGGGKVIVKNGQNNLELTLSASEPLRLDLMKNQDLPDGELQGAKGEIKKPMKTMCNYTYHDADKSEKTFHLLSSWPEKSSQ